MEFHREIKKLKWNYKTEILIELVEYKNIKQNTIPINPLTSTNENPINAHLIKLLLIAKLRPKLFNNDPNITPTPTPTPTNDINGKLEAIKRNPDNIIE